MQLVPAGLVSLRHFLVGSLDVSATPQSGYSPPHEPAIPMNYVYLSHITTLPLQTLS